MPRLQATGVPLVDELMRLRTLEAAVQYSTRLAAIVLAVGVIGTLALRLASRAAGRRAPTAPVDGFNVLAAAAGAALLPCQVLLPYGTGAYLLTLGASLGQVAATLRPQAFAALLCEWAGLQGSGGFSGGRAWVQQPARYHNRPSTHPSPPKPAPSPRPTVHRRQQRQGSWRL